MPTTTRIPRGSTMIASTARGQSAGRAPARAMPPTTGSPGPQDASAARTSTPTSDVAAPSRISRTTYLPDVVHISEVGQRPTYRHASPSAARVANSLRNGLGTPGDSARDAVGGRFGGATLRSQRVTQTGVTRWR